MKKYISFFRMKLIAGLQYRVAAYAGMATQFMWGGMEILIYRCFYLENQNSFPMQMQALASYIWLQQGLFLLFSWFLETEIINSISDGNIAYELCRPCSLIHIWICQSFAVCLPAPYGLRLPPSFTAAGLFVISGILGFLNVIAFGMIIYISTFFTISAQGIRIFAMSIVELLGGSVIPIPFLPDGLRQVVELLPFASMQNAPFRIYGGDIAGIEAIQVILLQLFWLVVMVLIGKAWINKALKRVVVQGG